MNERQKHALLSVTDLALIVGRSVLVLMNERQ
jgi:hypothetical protein